MAQKHMNFYELLNKHKATLYSLVVIITVLLFTNRLLLNNVVYESDDYKLHAVRTANYYLALKQGQFPVRWGPNLNGGYGYPSFNYMYHTPYLLGSLLHTVGFSVQESLNLAVLFSLLLGAVGCYFLTNSYLKSKTWCILLSLFFILNPYTLLNVYWRGAVGELFFYTIVPFFLLGIKKVLENNNSNSYFYLTVFSFMFLILSHLPSLLLLFILLFSFIVFEQKNKLTVKKIILVSYPCLLGLFLSAWYWTPAYLEQWMITYQKVGTLTEYLTQFVNPISVFKINRTALSSPYYLEVLQIGINSFLALFLGIYLLKYSKKIFIWLFLFLSSILLLSNYAHIFWDSIVFLQYIQFPWRFLWLIVIATTMIFIIFVSEKKVPRNIKHGVMVTFIFGLLFSSVAYTQNKGSTTRTDFDWYHPTFETGSSFNEHLPIWAKTAYYFPNELLFITASQAATLQPSNLETNVHKLSELNPTILQFDGKTISYQINPEEEIIILHKRLFYPGWEALLEGKNTEFITNIPEYEGILAIRVPNKLTTLTIEFTGFTKVRRIAEIVSLVTFVFLLTHSIIKKYKIKRHD